MKYDVIVIGAAEAAHDRAAFTADAGFDLIAIDRALALVEGMTGFKYSNFHGRIPHHQLIGGENTARAGADHNHIQLGHNHSSIIH